MTRLLMNSHNIPTAYILSTFVPAIFFHPLRSDVRADAPFSFLLVFHPRASKRYPVTRRSVSCGGDRTFFKIYGTIGKRSVTDVLPDEWRKCPARRFLELVRGIREKRGRGETGRDLHFRRRICMLNRRVFWFLFLSILWNYFHGILFYLFYFFFFSFISL